MLGINGHFVSGFVKETLPIYLYSDPNFENDPKLGFINAYELCHQKLLATDIDAKFSGTTCVTLLIDENRITTANAGDSRAIMASYKKSILSYNFFLSFFINHRLGIYPII